MDGRKLGNAVVLDLGQKTDSDLDVQKNGRFQVISGRCLLDAADSCDAIRLVRTEQMLHVIIAKRRGWSSAAVCCAQGSAWKVIMLNPKKFHHHFAAFFVFTSPRVNVLAIHFHIQELFIFGKVELETCPDRSLQEILIPAPMVWRAF